MGTENMRVQCILRSNVAGSSGSKGPHAKGCEILNDGETSSSFDIHRSHHNHLTFHNHQSHF
jgi:hypothetical protein